MVFPNNYFDIVLQDKFMRLNLTIIEKALCRNGKAVNYRFSLKCFTNHICAGCDTSFYNDYCT